MIVTLTVWNDKSQSLELVFAEENVQKFKSKLSGDQEVPPIQTNASGMAWYKPMADSIWYKINVTDIQGVTGAHIHSGKEGENGPVVVVLFTSDPPTGQITGKLVKGNITQDMLEGPMDGMQLSDLISTMKNNETYTNVHTELNPMGEIRGQIMSLNSTMK